MTDKLRQQLEGLSHLLLLQSNALNAADINQLGFIITNDTRQLVSYDTALFYHFQPGQRASAGKVCTVSDVASIEKKSEYSNVMKTVCCSCMVRVQEEVRVLTAEELDIPGDLAEKQFLASQPNLMWIPLAVTLKRKEGEEKHRVGGLLLTRVTPWREEERRILTHWQEGINHALVNLSAQSRLASRLWYNKRRRYVLLALAILLPVVMSIRVPLTTVAPAEVVPLDPDIVRAPLTGVIAQLHVKPNQAVQTGQLLISLDDREIKTQLQVAEQSFSIARAELDQAQQSALFDAKAKAALPLLRMRMEQQKAEYDYVSQLLVRSELRAGRDGIAVIANEHELVGKPVNIGERLLTLAELQQREIQVWIPVSDEIPLQDGARVAFYPETDPDSDIEAVVHRIALQAERTPEAGLAYRTLARIESGVDADTLRIGMRGSARVYGPQVSLFYYLFHKPMSRLRVWFEL